MSGPDFNESVHVRLLGGYFAIEVNEHMRGAFARRHRNHFAAVLAKSKPMRGSSRQVNQRARSSEHLETIDAQGYLSPDDIKRLIPRVTVRGRSTNPWATLVETLIDAGWAAGGKDGAPLTHA